MIHNGTGTDGMVYKEARVSWQNRADIGLSPCASRSAS